jgi:hypothetical protein
VAALGRLLRVNLPAADQPRYRDTALSDFAIIVHHWTFYAAVGLLTAAATIVTAEDSKLHGVLKIVLLLIGAGIGAAVGVGLLTLLGALAVAPHRQRNDARRHMATTAMAQLLPGVSPAAFVNGRLEEGNRLLSAWNEATDGRLDSDLTEVVVGWELGTFRGLGEKAPDHQARLRVEVGLGPEWFDEYQPDGKREPHARSMLRRRIHRLLEIADRLGDG